MNQLDHSARILPRTYTQTVDIFTIDQALNC